MFSRGTLTNRLSAAVFHFVILSICLFNRDQAGTHCYIKTSKSVDVWHLAEAHLQPEAFTSRLLQLKKTKKPTVINTD